MSTEPVKGESFPDAAVAALWQGEKIEAIKILREARRIDLKAAKDAVEEYVRTQPALQQKFKTSDSDTKRFLLRLTIITALAAAGLYYLFVS